jgi:ABC-type transport system involved in multi-copper enzyme maturation permease subunit
MSRLWSIARYTFQEHWRNRVYLTVLLFGVIVLGASLVISALAVEARTRMLYDLGLAAIEFISLITVVFVSVNLVLQEIESRTIYLLLSHPLPRWQYLTGRYLGTVAAIWTGMLAMGALHAGLLAWMGPLDGGQYALAWFCAAMKIQLVGALALLLSLFASSAPTAMALTLFLWITGHFSSELRFLAERSSLAVKALAHTLIYVSPNFSYFNFRDFQAMPPGPDWFLWLASYGLAYTLACLLLSNALFSRREF